jgi:predicted CoA-substrate-specific enzyme activase
MRGKNWILGLDIGSVAVAAVTVDETGAVRERFYRLHGGSVAAALEGIDADMDLSRVGAAALTGRPPAEIAGDASYDSQVAALESVAARHPEAGALLLVGGEKYLLARLTEDGDYEGGRGNSGCAAGTGSFLDQQAGRLGLRDSGELSGLALSNSDNPPRVATRCAVFAKTDLIHAQQEGRSLPAISDGLCRGLARNIVDALFKGEPVREPVVFTGGVALNGAVVEGIRKLTGLEILVDREAAWQGAIGAALLFGREGKKSGSFTTAVALRHEIPIERAAFLPPLDLRLSSYPDFAAHECWVEPTRARGGRPGGEVEVDLYQQAPSCCEVFLGIDIGSTSTKAALVDAAGRMLAGFYTRTSGRPVEAFQALFEAVEKLCERKDFAIRVIGCATTGSGRKFVGGIAGADLVLDEISAHARAAVELDPSVDTIIEIGGQDSKFTTLSEGRVTSSIMNNVCAAGTGSFIEEQARKLGVDVGGYADLTWGVRSPRVSDRCTVFMERDINHLLAQGCTVPEVLAAALHAVRENYLRKVASEKAIGKVVFFQGATAKNRSLVAAFEQKLGRPILVSPFCHLTGAYGAALALRDERLEGKALATTIFRGIEIHREELPVRSEVCGLCNNHCKLSVATIGGSGPAGGEEVAFGFLCGRDYGTKSFVAKKPGVARLSTLRAGAEAAALKAITVSPNGMPPRPLRAARAPVIGLPVALSLVEDLGFWKLFFSTLGIETRTSEGLAEAVGKGKERMGAEFCAPLAAFHGHALSLLDTVDFVFMPIMLEKKSDKAEGDRHFCYATQFTPAMVSQLADGDRFLMPLVESDYLSFRVKEELRRCLVEKAGFPVTFNEVSEAWDRAEAFRSERDRRYRELFATQTVTTRPGKGEIDIVLIGRPYSVISPGMNKGIPDIMADRGIRVWFQDMVATLPDAESKILPLIQEIPWEYGKRMLRAAEAAARTENLYPTLVTSFKCGPDSFVVDAFKAVMEAYGKPFLVLELDEHDSAVGYETRIEAAIRSFRNHRERSGLAVTASGALADTLWAERDFSAVNPNYSTQLKGKTLLLPCWDDLAAPLLVATLHAAGIQAIVMDETDETIRASLSTNNGQCLPLNAIAESYAATVRRRGLDPATSALWMAKISFSCNIPLYPHQIKRILEGMGGGMEKAGLYTGELTFVEISPLAALDAYLSYLFAGLIRRLACRIRPYEAVPGMTDAMVRRAIEILVPVFEDRRKNKVKAAEEIVALFEAIPFDKTRRNTQVGLFGDFYVRDNRVMNQDVIRFIEANGGEVISMPYNQYAKMVAGTYFARWIKEGRLAPLLGFNALLAASKVLEKAYYRLFGRLLDETDPNYDDPSAEILARYGVLEENSGESAENLLKTWYIKKHFPDIALFVQLSPVFCCAGLVTEAMNQRIEEVTGVPVLSLIYDGTGGSKNEAIAPYLRYPRKARVEPEPELKPADRRIG